MNILIVDDSRAMRSIVLRTLRQAGFQHHTFTEASGAAEALAEIRVGAPDLVLCDWNMPGMSGIDLLNTLRAEGREIAFGLVTSEASSEMARLALEAGAQFLVTKPFTPESIREAIAPFMGT